MNKYISLSMLFFCLASSVVAQTPTTRTGKISTITFYGSDDEELMFLTLDPQGSECNYNAYVLPAVKDRPGITSALLAAFQAQNTVTIHGTGECFTPLWGNYEIIDYAGFQK